MNDGAWERVLDVLDTKFELRGRKRSSEPLEDNPKFTQSTESYEFNKDGAEYRIERVTRPAVAERKTHYHKAASGNVRFENIYDPEETTAKVQLFKNFAGEWKEVDLETLAL
jgi:hypothetical protein